MDRLEILTKIIGELNDRCFDESIATGTGIKPFELCTTGEEVWVNFLGNPVLTDDEINDGNDQDGKRIDIYTRLGEAYQDSELCEKTYAALADARAKGLV